MTAQSEGRSVAESERGTPAVAEFWAAEAWPTLDPGRPVTILKRHPDGREATRYPGVAMAGDIPTPWVAIRAAWVRDVVELDGLRFVPGDTLHEFFSPAHPFNVFTVISPEGTIRGWYANVTHPATLDTTTDPWTLAWHDLYLDLIGLPDGVYAIRDEDELAEAGLLGSDPVLHGAILAAGTELVTRFQRRDVPFHEG